MMLRSAARDSEGGFGAGGWWCCCLFFVFLVFVFFFLSAKYLRSVEISEIKEIPVYRKIQLYFRGGYKKCVS